MKLSIIGAGYVGLVTGACFAELGHDVIVMDIDEDRVKKLSRGIVPIYEPGLDRLIKKNMSEERLRFTTNLEESTRDAEFHFISVWTPTAEDGSADLTAVFAVAEDLGKMLHKTKSKNPIVITKSTVPVGTGEEARRLIKKSFAGDFSIASNPEFLREGQAVADMMHPDRVVVGSDSAQASQRVMSLYKDVGGEKIMTDLATAEMIKYAANAFLATKISFMNEIANVCDILGADVDMVREGIGTDKRINKHFLYPGIGFGGSCLPKDARALHKFAQDKGYDFKVLKSVMEVNDQQCERIIEKLEKHVKDFKGKDIYVLGLAFKSNTDDVRESSAVDLIKRLQKKGAKVRAHDPEALITAQKVLEGDIAYHAQPLRGVEGADAIIIATEWPEFRELPWGDIKGLMKNPLVIDGRNLLDPTTMREHGFEYESIGRK